jgi:predicted GNAT superfamily acetyltransferase
MKLSEAIGMALLVGCTMNVVTFDIYQALNATFALIGLTLVLRAYLCRH